jgi:uncharacterized protein (DUF433 family)
VTIGKSQNKREERNKNMSTNTRTSVETLISKVKKAAKEIEPALKQVNAKGVTASLPADLTEAPKIYGINCAIESSAEAYIWDRLCKLGIYCDEGSHELLLSDDCTEGEARRIFCENGQPNLPPIRFKRLWSILKEGSQCSFGEKPENQIAEVHAATKEVRGMPVIEEYKVAIETIVKANRPVGQWSDEELLKAYNPTCDPTIFEVLDKKAHERPFIIFQNEAEGTIDVEASLSLLRQARKGKTPVHYPVKNVLKRLYRAGHFPSLAMFQCPFHPGVILVNGYCDECEREWNVEKYEEMQFARIVYEMGQAPKDKAYIGQFINELMQYGIVSKDGNAGLKDDYPKAYATYLERKADDSLPRIKVRTSQEREVSDPMNPSRTY